MPTRSGRRVVVDVEYVRCCLWEVNQGWGDVGALVMVVEEGG
jgi:hypothetical protein